jgi:hypothetical protein
LLRAFPWPLTFVLSLFVLLQAASPLTATLKHSLCLCVGFRSNAIYSHLCAAFRLNAATFSQDPRLVRQTDDCPHGRQNQETLLPKSGRCFSGYATPSINGACSVIAGSIGGLTISIGGVFSESWWYLVWLSLVEPDFGGIFRIPMASGKFLQHHVEAWS